MTRYPWWVEDMHNGTWSLNTHKLHDGELWNVRNAVFELEEDADYVVKLVNADILREAMNE